LSLIPGPAGTLSRCAPTITTFCGSPNTVSAMTLWSVPRVRVASTLSRTVAPGVLASSWPTPKSANTIGMPARHSPMSTVNASVRPGWPSLKTMTPAAPASAALRTFVTNGQVPRWINAIRPDTKPAKSAVSQPLVDDGAGVGGSVTSTAWTCAVTSPGGDGRKVKNSSLGT
jgi:hypothetical protein